MSFSETELSLMALLDFLIPPDPARGLPGASQVGFPPDSLAHECLEMLDDASSAKYARKFYALRPEEKAFISANLKRTQKTCLTRLSKHLAEYYYLNQAVARILGVGDCSPFPNGFHVEEGDLMLLEPVYQRGKIYRDV